MSVQGAQVTNCRILCALAYGASGPERVHWCVVNCFDPSPHAKVNLMNGIVYIVGLIVIIAVVLSFFGLR